MLPQQDATAMSPAVHESQVCPFFLSKVINIFFLVLDCGNDAMTQAAGQ